MTSAPPALIGPAHPPGARSPHGSGQKRPARAHRAGSPAGNMTQSYRAAAQQAQRITWLQGRKSPSPLSHLSAVPVPAAVTSTRDHGSTHHGLRTGLSAAFPAVRPLKANREHHLGRPNAAYGFAGPDHAGILTGPLPVVKRGVRIPGWNAMTRSPRCRSRIRATLSGQGKGVVSSGSPSSSASICFLRTPGAGLTTAA
jgi:hypothetical protein